MRVDDLIANLDVEEKARAKDTPSMANDGTSNANFVQKSGAKYKGKQQNPKAKNTTNFKKKKEGIICYVCGEPGHKANKCHNRKGKKGGQQNGQNTVNVVVSEPSTAGYDSNPAVLMACQSAEWLVDTGANIHVCADLNLFSSCQATSGSPILMGNGSGAAVLGVGKVDLKFTSGKIITLKNVQYVPSINRNLISGSLLFRDGFKLVFESNNVVISKFGLFIGKGYECGGLFRTSLLDAENKFVHNTISVLNSNKDASIWHSRLCHVNLGSISRMSSLNLIPKFSIVRGSRCQICVQAKQPRKPFLAVEERSTAPLELVHSDLCEMGGVLTKAGKRYFLSFIDDATRFCYLYLLKTKDEALNYFKIYKAEVENQLNGRIKRLRSDRGGEYVSSEFSQFCAEH